MTTATIELKIYPNNWEDFQTTYDVTSLYTLNQDDAYAMKETPCKWFDDLIGHAHMGMRAALRVPSDMTGKKIATIVCAIGATALRRCDLYIDDAPEWIAILHETAQELFESGRYDIVKKLFNGEISATKVVPTRIVQESSERLKSAEFNIEKLNNQTTREVTRIRRRACNRTFNIQRDGETIRMGLASFVIYDGLVPVMSRILLRNLPKPRDKRIVQTPTCEFHNVRTNLHKLAAQLVGNDICIDEAILRNAIREVLDNLDFVNPRIISSLRFRCHDVATDVSFLMRDYDGNVHNVTGFAIENEAMLG